MAALADEVRETYSLSLSTHYAERCLGANASLTSSSLFAKALRENLRDICGGSLLPYGIAAQVSATLPNDVVMQISTSRDATQPLRPCADIAEEDAMLNAASQRNSDKRLLRLLLTDGTVEIPALELSTLHAFKSIPIPGEKVLVRKTTEVRNGCILMSDSTVSLLGGEVIQLKQDFLAHRRRLEAGYQTSSGLEGAPRFAPLLVGQQYHSNMAVNGIPRDAAHQGSVVTFPSNDSGQDRDGGYHRQGNRGNASGGGYRGRGFNANQHRNERAGRGGRGGCDGEGRQDGFGGRGRGGGGGGYPHGGYRGRGTGPSHHADVSNLQRYAEQFPALNEANFPRLS